MNALIRLHNAIFDRLTPLSDAVLPTLARFAFAAVLFMYFWNSGLTKIPDGFASLINPSFNAFAQIFPKGAEAASYDITQATTFQKAVILAGTWSEFILPILIVVGLFTRVAAIGMIGFIVVQSLTDLFGHGAINDPATLGAWFDGASGSLILDQRTFWVVALAILVFRGGGPLSVDRFIRAS
ncbi:MAG: DoxX family membrane protein [Pseudomonadota bacterium]